MELNAPQIRTKLCVQWFGLNKMGRVVSRWMPFLLMATGFYCSGCENNNEQQRNIFEAKKASDQFRKELEELLGKFEPFESGDEKLSIAAFEYLLNKFGPGSFIIAENYDLPENVFDALSKHLPCKYSRADLGKSKNCKEKLNVHGKFFISKETVQVHWSRYFSPLNGEAGILTLKKAAGQWKVISNRTLGIS